MYNLIKSHISQILDERYLKFKPFLKRHGSLKLNIKIHCEKEKKTAIYVSIQIELEIQQIQITLTTDKYDFFAAHKLIYTKKKSIFHYMKNNNKKNNFSKSIIT